MCFIEKEIKSSPNTQIFIATNVDKKRQIVIYSNKIENLIDDNFIIIPVPNPTTIKFHNLINYENFFDDCKKNFNLNLDSKYKKLNNYVDENEYTPIKKDNIGSYKISIALNLQRLFALEINETLKKILSAFYHQPYWGFIICKLDHRVQYYNPIIYSHDIIDNKIYIPTRHFIKKMDWSEANYWELGMPINPNSGPVNKAWNESTIDNSPMFSSSLAPVTTADRFGWLTDKKNIDKNLDKNIENDNQYKKVSNDWNHSIYLYNIDSGKNLTIREMNNSRYGWNEKLNLNLEMIDFNFEQCNNFEKIKIDTINNNIDLVIPLN